jgi:MFS transporter, FHS family, glucose/mannose:H+ symporter
MLCLGIATFFAFGIVLVLLGASQAELARDLGLDLAGSGLLGASLAVGIGAGVVAAGPLCDRFARRPLFVGAAALSGVALIAIGPGRGFALIVLLLFLLGLGCGAFITVVNAAVVDRFRTGTTRALALVHSAATFGAFVGPLFVQLLLRQGNWSTAFHVLGFMHGAIVLGGLLARFHGDASAKSPPVTRERSLWSPALIALGAIAFAYVGTENGLTLFAVPWALERSDSESVGQWSISAFWFGLLIGRLSLALRAAERPVRLLAAGGLAGGTIIIATSALSLGPLVGATALAGLALGPVYPLLVSLAARRFPSAPGAAVGIVTGLGAAGGTLVPWVVGWFGDVVGLRAAMTLLGVNAWIIALAALTSLRFDALRHRSLQYPASPPVLRDTE